MNLVSWGKNITIVSSVFFNENDVTWGYASQMNKVSCVWCAKAKTIGCGHISKGWIVFEAKTD